MTKITTFIDEKLLKEAIKETRARSQREVLEEGLRRLMANVRAKRFARDLKHLKLGLTMKELRGARA
jgi:hypothetical protein